MCGRYTVVTDPELIAERFQASVPASWERRFNVAPTQDVLAVIERKGERRLGTMRWGLVPHWADDLKIGSKMINARAESLTERPAFRSLLERRRCLIVADGFYEWRRDPDGARRPVRFTLRDEELFAFAGLWAAWRDRTSGESVYSCTIVTTRANDLVAPLHDRMPVILPRAGESTWLDETVAPAEALALLEPFPAAEMACSDASMLVNSPDNDDDRCFDPLA